jgi:hypothetical protein
VTPREIKIRLIAGIAILLVTVTAVKWIGSRRPAETESGRESESLPKISAGRSTGGESKSIHPADTKNGIPSESTAAPQAAVDVSREAHAGCFLAKFQHSRTTGHQTRADCSKHQNEIVLASDSGLMKALQEKAPVCVRVDGNTIDFEKKGNRLIFGNVAGPDSVLTVRYCLGKSKCSDSCQPGKDSKEKDTYMEALGASDEDDSATASAAKWDPADQDEGDVASEYADVLEAEKKQARTQLVLSSAWTPETVTTGCNITSVSSR